MGQVVSFAASRSQFPSLRVGLDVMLLTESNDDINLIAGVIKEMTDTTLTIADEIDDFGTTRDVLVAISSIQSRLE